MKHVVPHWLLICLISRAHFPDPARMDPDNSSCIWFETSPLCSYSQVETETEHPKDFYFQVWKCFPRAMDRFPAPKKFKDMMFDQIEAVLQIGPPRLAWLRYYRWTTFNVKSNGEKVILLVYWPLTQWLVKQVSTPSQSHSLPHISNQTFNSDTHQLWYFTLILTHHITTIFTVHSTAAY
jgi:hypothetical protein